MGAALTVCAPTATRYNYAQQLQREQFAALSGGREALERFQQLQANVDQGCKYSETDSKVLTGKDCYDIKTS